MSTIKAVTVGPEEKVPIIADLPLPKFASDYVLVKPKAIAINPTDWKHVYGGGTKPGSRVGCDYAGIVEDVGADVKNFKKGDRIAGMTHGSNAVNHNTGAFAEYLIAKAAVQFHLPDNVSFEEGATLGVSVHTVGQGLYKMMGLPLPPTAPANPQITVLLHGGSTATGLYGIQFAKASGARVIATASPHNHELLKSLGAEAVFDYRDPECGKKINEYTGNRLGYAWDLVGGGEEMCVTALSSTEKAYLGAINAPFERPANAGDNVTGPVLNLAYEVAGEAFVAFGKEWPAKPDELEHATKIVPIVEKLLKDGAIRTTNPDVNRGGSGLEGALKGLDELRDGKVSGTKLVYTM